MGESFIVEHVEKNYIVLVILWMINHHDASIVNLRRSPT